MGVKYREHKVLIDNIFEIASLPETGVIVAAHQSIYWMKKKGGLAVLINRFSCTLAATAKIHSRNYYQSWKNITRSTKKKKEATVDLLSKDNRQREKECVCAQCVRVSNWFLPWSGSRHVHGTVLDGR